MVRRVRHAVPATVLAAVLASATAACGTSASSPRAKTANSTRSTTVSATPTSTASRDPLAALSGDQIAVKAIADTKAASSVRVTGTMKDSGQTLTIDLALVLHQGCRGSMTESKNGSIKLIDLGKKIWIMPSETFYKSVGAGAATLSVLAGKWLAVKAGSSDLGSLATLCEINKLLDGFKPPSSPGALAVTATSTVNGQRAVKVADTGDSAYLLVSDRASPRLLRIVAPSASAAKLAFSDYGASFAVHPPPSSEVVDGSRYGF